MPDTSTPSALADVALDQWPSEFQPHVVRQAYGAQRLSSYTIALEAWRRGLHVRFRSSNGVQMEIADGVRTVGFNGSRSSDTTNAAIRVVEDKNRTIEYLREASVPVPVSRLFVTKQTSREELVRIAESEFRWPVVIKPVAGSMGRGVFVNITTSEELRRCYDHLVREKNTERVLLEEHVSGDDYRIYVAGDAVAGACRRIPAFVTGDGRHSIRELIGRKNSVRRRNPFLSKGLIRPDFEIDSMLERQSFEYSSIPPDGHHVQLRQKANASAGGDVEDVTDELPDVIKEAAVAAVRQIPGLAAGGVDVLYNPGSPGPSDFVVIELNARAHIGVNMYPTQGRGQDVPRAIVDHFFPQSCSRSAPDSHTLAMNFDEVLKPLMSRSADVVQVAALPEHRYPERQVFSLPGNVSLTKRQRRVIAAASRSADVSGAIHTQTDPARLVVAGTSEGIEKFVKRVEQILGLSLTEPGAWVGTVFQGFYFSARELLTEPSTDS